MTDIHTAIRNLKAKTAPEENLSVYFHETLAAAKRYSECSLALEYLTLCDTYRDLCEDGPSGLSADIRTLFSEINALVRTFAFRGPLTADEVKRVRRSNISAMEKITDSTDLFLINEHILNRLEHKFEGSRELPLTYSDSAFTDRIMQATAAIPEEERNLFLSELFRQLPFRMTKQKFFDSLKERLSIYRESDLSSLTGMIDMLRSAAGLRLEAGDNDAADPLTLVRSALSGKDLKELTEERYFMLKEDLINAGETLNLSADFVNQQQRVLNQLLISVLADANTDCEASDDALGILRIASSLYGLPGSGEEETSDTVYDLEKAFELCTKLEGIPEESNMTYREDIGFLRDLESRFGALISAEPFNAQDSALNDISLLISDSDYASLEDITEDHPMTEEEFNEKTDSFVREFAEHAEKVNKTCIRAEMALMNGLLPPRFSTEEGLETYIFESLRSCTDVSEKLGCIDIIEQLMSERN